MWSYSALVLLVTALTRVSAQDFFEGNIVKKDKSKLVAINIQDAKGKKIYELKVMFLLMHSAPCVVCFFNCSQ